MSEFFSDLARVLRPVRVKAIGIVLLFLILSVFDLVGVGLIVPFFTILLNPASAENAWIFEYLAVIGVKEDQATIFLASTIVVIFGLKAVSSTFVQWLILAFIMGFRAQLTKRMMEGYLALPYSFFVRKSTSEMIQTIVVNLRIVTDDLLLPLFKLCAEMIVALLLIGLLFSLSPGTFLALTATMATFGGSFVAFARKPLKRSGRKAVEASEDLIRGVNEGFNSVKESKVLGVEDRFATAVWKTARNLANHIRLFYTLSVVPKYIMEFTVVFFVMGLIVLSASRGVEAETLLPVLAAFGFAGFRLIPAFSQFFATLNAINYSRHALVSLNQDIKFIEEVDTQLIAMRDQGARVPQFKSLSIHNVLFSFAPDNPDVPTLGPVSLNLEAGDSLGIVGPSGSGKTTFADLILHLLRPNSGDIILTDVEGRRIPESDIKSLFAYIPQQEFIIEDTVEKNITLSLNADELDKDRLKRALDLSRFDSVVARLPQGLKTICGEGGKLLSGGERQRLAIARAIYHKRQVLVMDEVTSALDSETELEIVNSLQELREAGITIIMITHRESTLRICNRIVKVNNGNIVEVRNP